MDDDFYLQGLPKPTLLLYGMRTNIFYKKLHFIGLQISTYGPAAETLN